MSSKKHGQSHAQKTNKPHPVTPPPERSDHSECVKQKTDAEPPNAKKRLGMSGFERIMAMLTFFGLVIAGLTGGIFWNQLGEMRTDQRAWMSLSAGKVSFSQDKSGQTTVVVPISISNTGKTPARHFLASVVVEKVPNGQPPKLLYENIPRTTDSTGMFRPNTQHSIDAGLLERDPADSTGNKARYRVLSVPEYQDLVGGNAYIAIYAYSSYDDIFGKHHWDKYCVFTSPSPTPVQVTAKACTDYNDTDDN